MEEGKKKNACVLYFYILNVLYFIFYILYLYKYKYIFIYIVVLYFKCYVIIFVIHSPRKYRKLRRQCKIVCKWFILLLEEHFALMCINSYFIRNQESSLNKLIHF